MHVTFPKDTQRAECREFVLESWQWKEAWAIPDDSHWAWLKPWRRDYKADVPRKQPEERTYHKSRRGKLAEFARALMKASELAQWCGYARPFPWPWVWLKNGNSVQYVPYLGLHVPEGM